MKVLYLDCFAGISGNMLLGALIQAGLPELELRAAWKKLPLSNYEIDIHSVNKCGIQAIYVDVKPGEGHHHRHLPDIFRIIDDSTLSVQVKQQSKRVFTILAEAEAKVHGTTSDHVHFHEVGAVDSIIDIVGIVFALDYLGIGHIYASKVQVGSGFVRCSHGLMPVPAPATAELLKSIPTYQGDIKKELTTPTGAAILAAYGRSYGEKPAGFITDTLGYGAGTHELDIPNVLRLHLGHVHQEKSDVQSEDLWMVETNIDDSTPQVLAYAMERLFEMGVNDAWLTPIVMKKNRAAVMLSVLTPYKLKQKVCDFIFTETSSIGLRFYPVQRTMAERKMIRVALSGGSSVAVKVSSYQGQVTQVMPEYEDCQIIARQSKIPLKWIQQQASENAWKFVHNNVEVKD
ncbi:hypothetical protein Ga0466249_004172 [Sporomusaceae bacterium BoRhaA]|uniref:nickel pincer cofactor biosynthesis protein LarC n=1 Tax=Pelorhabdus rhamnosifermentans TaxID=2772457 RepID=UPI001C05F617|nr:nickel pincer cofactor biosynthesis protein LarC [Pelorhabdus rhamnosifermentans]MBU2703036.1 hypothetical protein [Pelorhabdus rhamnosifermentans]